MALNKITHCSIDIIDRKRKLYQFLPVSFVSGKYSKSFEVNLNLIFAHNFSFYTNVYRTVVSCKEKKNKKTKTD